MEIDSTHVSKFPNFSALLAVWWFWMSFWISAEKWRSTICLLVFLKIFLALLSMSLKFCIFFVEQITSLEFQCVACDFIHLARQNDLMRRDVQECSARCSRALIIAIFRSRHVRGSCNCNMNFIASRLLILLSCFACLLKVQLFSAFFSPENMSFCQQILVIVNVCFFCEVLCISPRRVRWYWSATNLRVIKLCKLGSLHARPCVSTKKTRRGYLCFSKYYWRTLNFWKWRWCWRTCCECKFCR